MEDSQRRTCPCRGRSHVRPGDCVGDCVGAGDCVGDGKDKDCSELCTQHLPLPTCPLALQQFTHASTAAAKSSRPRLQLGEGLKRRRGGREDEEGESKNTRGEGQGE
eukprot:1304880-Rhodomonas_salina.1